VWLNPDKPVVAQGVLDYRYFQKLVYIKEHVKHGHIINKVTLLHQLNNNQKEKVTRSGKIALMTV